MEENYQKRNYALAVFSLTVIIIFWVLCLVAPLANETLANTLSTALIAPVIMILQFFYRKAKGEGDGN